MEIKLDDISGLKQELKASNKAALTLLFDTYHQELCVYAYHFTGDHEISKDIVQNVFVNLWKRRKKLNSIDSIKNFLYKSVYNGFLNHYRDSKKFTDFDFEYMVAIEDTSHENEENLKRQIEILRLEVEKLPPKCKRIFIMSKQEGLTNIEIADFLNISIKTVENHITNAFKILRERLKNKAGLFYFLMLTNVKTFDYLENIVSGEEKAFSTYLLEKSCSFKNSH